jgi:hypothetical protein
MPGEPFSFLYVFPPYPEASHSALQRLARWDFAFELRIYAYYHFGLVSDEIIDTLGTSPSRGYTSSNPAQAKLRV